LRVTNGGRVVRVLVVDDSAYVRKAVRQMLTRSPFIEVVGAAHDGEEALELVEHLCPDVVTTDLNMPRLDGVGFVRAQVARRPLPIILLGIASESDELVMQALDAGAADVVRKPTALATEKVMEVAEELIAKVKAAAAAKVRPRPRQRRGGGAGRRRQRGRGGVAGNAIGVVGHNVRSVRDGHAAVSVVHQFRPDLVFMDLGMPALSGYDACRQIRSADPARRVVMVALTGWGQDPTAVAPPRPGSTPT
jgi:chemotaxis response regulator CheB